MNASIVSTVGGTRSRTAVLAVVVTAASAIFAWFLAAVAGLSEEVVVISVMVVAFVSSWVVTNAPDHRQHRRHRVTMVPIRTRAS